MKRVNRGWIYYTRSEGHQDSFYVSTNATGEVKGMFVGTGVLGSEAAVNYFESELKLGPIKLEPYGPLGLRVYTEEEEVGDLAGPFETTPELEAHLKQVGALPKTPVDRLTEMVDAMARLSEAWADNDPHYMELLNEHYPKGWPNFEEMVGDAVTWLNKVKGKP